MIRAAACLSPHPGDNGGAARVTRHRFFTRTSTQVLVESHRLENECRYPPPTTPDQGRPANRGNERGTTMPICFSRSDDMAYMSAARRQDAVKLIMTTAGLRRHVDATRGELYRAASAGTGFMSQVDGVVSVYVLSWVHSEDTGKTGVGFSIDVQLQDKYYRIVFDDCKGTSVAQRITQITQVAETPRMRMKGQGLGNLPDVIVTNQQPVRGRTGDIEEDYGVAPNFSPYASPLMPPSGPYASPHMPSVQYGNIPRPAGNYGIAS